MQTDGLPLHALLFFGKQWSCLANLLLKPMEIILNNKLFLTIIEIEQPRNNGTDQPILPIRQKL